MSTVPTPTPVPSCYKRNLGNYTYVAFADDATGTGFVTEPDESKPFLAIITSVAPLTSLSAADFEGKWLSRSSGAAGSLSGVGSPEGVISAGPGVTYFQTDNSALWIKGSSGTGNLGWVNMIEGV